MLLVLLRHLRYFVDPVWFWVVWLQPFGKYAAVAMVFGLSGLWLRRILISRIRYVSSPSDHLMLALLLAVALSGLALQTVAHTDIVAVKIFALGLLNLDWQSLPANPVLWAHLTGAAVLCLVLPFSKLLHIPGVFFSPTRNQRDNPREERYLPHRTATDNVRSGAENGKI